MLLAHRLEVPEHRRSSVVQLPPTLEEVAELAEVAMQMDDARALELVESRLRSGLPYEAVLLDFVAAAARVLGDRWHTDGLTFADVTVGLATLQRIVTELRQRARSPRPHPPTRPLS
ncbi:MAG: hypothetical protein IAG13_07500 [Deltaproteobacteria bacterium]|nr:hypothetical protein [Nannocystaceae bacterium]